MAFAWGLMVRGCTNLLVSSGATSDSSTILTYNADSGSLYGMLYHYQATANPPGTMRKVFDWDSGIPLGAIPEASATFNVVGNMNEHGLAITETTYGGWNGGAQAGAIVDYGSLIWITLQRAKTARDAIHIMDDIMQTFGYASEGESFSLADGKEVWIMEVTSKGAYEKGSVWVAQRVPDGSISAHANQARITTFPFSDPENCLYSSDVVSFARKAGLYPADVEALPDAQFDFSRAYDPITFSGARFCDARVYALFGAVMGAPFLEEWSDYAMGKNLTRRLPLFVTPPSKLTQTQVMSLMRSHYEGTSMDMSGATFDDTGAAFSSIPYRAHPLTWPGPNGQTFLNERPVATQQTGFNYVAVTRAWMPRELRGLLWMGVDDSSTTVRLPVYSSATRVPAAFGGKGPQDGVTPPMMTPDFDRAFYAFNLVANWAYSRWAAIYPEVLSEITARETAFHQAVSALDERALQLLQSSSDSSAAVELVTAWAEAEGDRLVRDWKGLFGRLFVKYRDGYIITPNADSLACGCSASSLGYPQPWYNKIAETVGVDGTPQFLVPSASLEGESTRGGSFTDKAALLARR